ncbi:hypothetical protein CAPTEDRAFT_201294 [Capitella teleta]|uniref:ATP-grasp domain-containing protein n=1 Tax=Capitella teleta TaxID=283909 RepID=R7UTA9_CAPTE|nr:hypothetical protein CAPTEDRAFT_201294 [Capitella teleta]|eukprot:ELU09403.1 hypothetical protein CAPTEDRAFT_201294 [Capitella teleta]
MYRALVITNSLPQAEEIHGRLLSGKFPDMAFRYPSQLSRETIDLKTLIERCSEVIKEEEIDVIISLYPEFSLVHGILLEEFPALRGPSTESTFLCCNRVYLREKVLQGFNVKHSIHDISELTRDTIESDIEDLHAPIIIKDAYSFHTSIDKKLKSLKNITKDTKAISNLVKLSFVAAKSILDSRINMQKYPAAFDTSYVVEEHISHNTYSVTMHYVEACVKDGVIIPWAISDINYYRHRPHYTVQCVSVPSSIDENDNIQVWAVFREALQHLIATGFNYQFIHAKIALSNRGSIKIMDMSPCLLSMNGPIYNEVFHDGDNLRGQMDLGLGREQWTPKLRPGKFAMTAVVSTHHRGVLLADLVNLAAAKAASSTVKVLCMDSEVNDDRLTEDGSPLVAINTFQNSRSECLRQVREYCAEVLTMVSKEAVKPYLPPLTPAITVEKPDPLPTESRSRALSPLTLTSAQTDRNADELQTFDVNETNLHLEGSENIDTARSSVSMMNSSGLDTDRPSLMRSSVDAMHEIHNVNQAFSPNPSVKDGEHPSTTRSAKGDLHKRKFSYGARNATEVGDLLSNTKPGILPHLEGPQRTLDRIEHKKSLIREGAFHLGPKEDAADTVKNPVVSKQSGAAALPNIARVQAEIRALRSNSFSVPQGKGKNKAKTNSMLSDLEKLRQQGVLDRRVSTPGLRNRKHLLRSERETENIP